MSSEPMPEWLDEQNPYEADASVRQIESLRFVLRRLAETRSGPLKVLELGCGTGRMLLPLAHEGYDLVGIDCNGEALSTCRESLTNVGYAATLLEQDFLAEPWPRQQFDAVLCLGNTFMTIADLDAALKLLRNAATSLTDGGVFVLDDLPGEFWPELTEGNWQSGISEDGSAQLIWDARDSVFALRSGDAVDVDSWEFKPGDRRLRLWTQGTISLACQLAGLSEPAVHPGLLAVNRSCDDPAA